MQSSRWRQQQDGISSSWSSSTSLLIPGRCQDINIKHLQSYCITEVTSHVIESVVLLLHLFALHAVDEDIGCIVRSEDNGGWLVSRYLDIYSDKPLRNIDHAGAD